MSTEISRNSKKSKTHHRQEELLLLHDNICCLYKQMSPSGSDVSHRNNLSVLLAKIQNHITYAPVMAL